MNRVDMKHRLKDLAKPLKDEHFCSLFTKEELSLMKYLYLEKLEQWWVAEELGVSIPTLTKWHNNCVDQIISYFYYEQDKLLHGEDNKFKRYFYKDV